MSNSEESIPLSKEQTRIISADVFQHTAVYINTLELPHNVCVINPSKELIFELSKSNFVTVSNIDTTDRKTLDKNIELDYYIKTFEPSESTFITRKQKVIPKSSTLKFVVAVNEAVKDFGKEKTYNIPLLEKLKRIWSF